MNDSSMVHSCAPWIFGWSDSSVSPWCNVRHHSVAKWSIGTTAANNTPATAERMARDSAPPPVRRNAR